MSYGRYYDEFEGIDGDSQYEYEEEYHDEFEGIDDDYEDEGYDAFDDYVRDNWY